MMCGGSAAKQIGDYYKEMARLLRPGGVFVIITNNNTESDWFQDTVVPCLLVAKSAPTSDDKKERSRAKRAATTESDQAKSSTKLATSSMSYKWRVTVHCSEVGPDGKEGCPSVFFIQKSGRQLPLRAGESPMTVEELWHG